MASPQFQSTDFQTPVKKKCSSSSSISSPSSISTTSTNPKQRSITDSSSNNNDETITTIKMEDGNDEIKIYSASTIKKNEPDDDIDIDGIEDRLSPVVEEPTSPNKNDAFNSSISGLYTSPFLYPYFHPMFHPYLMAAAAQANAAVSSTDKSSTDGQIPSHNPYGTVPSTLSPFPGFNPGMPFPSLYPPGMANQPFRPNLFNPFGIPIPTPGVRPPAPSSSSSSSSSNRHHQNYDGSSRNLSALLDVQRPKKPHIKKPLNAFMLYMKEQRARVIEECTLKESSAINKVLGQKWKELPRAEQDRYYELAKEERNRHMQMYPGWSARDNYGLKKKRQSSGHTPILNNSHKKAPRENNSMVNSPGHLNHNSPHRYGHQQSHLINSPHMNSTKNPMQLENDCLNQKKCRARFGLEGQSQWCKHCRRKKKCTRFLEEDMSNHANNNHNHNNNNNIINNYHNSSYNNHAMNMSNNRNSSSVSSPQTNQSDNDDSINEPDGDDILSRQVDSIEDDDDDDDDDENDDEHHTNDDDSDEENKQQQQQPVPLVYKPIPSKIDSHQQAFQPPPPAHLYQPQMLPSHFAPNFHY
ncbi:unnamed protein product [Rotaria sp. Silwood1]|nr:unnamed protein product [Rotaria sp. Silwood1]CAF1074798.1 unnamed protein product [Rotaria sp. Silwood1]CAF1081600.1 unnamed protein product [Rotaria sp. Silwood1]CAF3410927.1 unnamed protein product [Rotaria sp. Silwood1]CAF3437587.1 unnamed protein product [Rotaria sp. Silwood1]